MDRLPRHLFSTRGWGLLAAGAVSLLAAQIMGRRDLLALAILLIVLPAALAGRNPGPVNQGSRSTGSSIPPPVETAATTTVRLAVARTGTGTGQRHHGGTAAGQVRRIPGVPLPGAVGRRRHQPLRVPSAVRQARPVPDRPGHGRVHRPVRAVPAPPRHRRRRHPHRDARRRRPARDRTGRRPRKRRRHGHPDPGQPQRRRRHDPRIPPWRPDAPRALGRHRPARRADGPAGGIRHHAGGHHHPGPAASSPSPRRLTRLRSSAERTTDGNDLVTSDDLRVGRDGGHVRSAPTSPNATTPCGSWTPRAIPPFLHSPSAPEPEAEEYSGAAGLQSVAESLAAIQLSGPHHTRREPARRSRRGTPAGGRLRPRPFRRPAHGQALRPPDAGPVLAILGSLSLAEARALAPAAGSARTPSPS